MDAGFWSAAAVGWTAGQVLSETFNDVDNRYECPPHQVTYGSRPSSPVPLYDPYNPTPPPPRPRNRLRRRDSLDEPISNYIREKCVDIIGTEGHRGIDNHQAYEQVFFLQNRALQHLEEDHIDEPEYQVNDLSLRKEAREIRDRFESQVRETRRAERIERRLQRSDDPAR